MMPIHVEHSYVQQVAEFVLAGDVELARYAAMTFAAARDAYPTSAELVAAASALSA
ncbi:hypothetical protein [uncultured Microbacterium sp.]|uniref:hypothetical protein n=1 Tax=uncultured Microbacterium sp. TaxID=191216 RepID=UPI0026075402|nr:hypothetical protein [uncultured Microbacterium sp.]